MTEDFENKERATRDQLFRAGFEVKNFLFGVSGLLNQGLVPGSKLNHSIKILYSVSVS